MFSRIYNLVNNTVIPALETVAQLICFFCLDLVDVIDYHVRVSHVFV